MEYYRIHGQKQLSGSIAVSGAKNFALKCFGAAIMMDGPFTMTNVPEIEDVRRMREIMIALGADMTFDADAHTLRIDASEMTNDLTATEAGKIRASILLIGPLLSRRGSVRIPHPGGCVLGRRPIDIFVDGFRAMGANVEEEANAFVFQATQLHGAEIYFPVMSVTATESLMITATRAQGRTVLKNAACEPEVVELARLLNACGASIMGAGTSTIVIEGTSTLSGVTWACMPDRIEAGTFAILAAATRSTVTITDCVTEQLESVLAMFDRICVPYTRTADTLTVQSYTHTLRASDLRTHEYPGFVTDLQAPMTVLLTQTQGMSMVHETVFEGRLFYTDMLNRMGASIVMCDPHRVLVSGPTALRGKTIESPDIRAGIALVLAGCIASGETIIQNIYQIDRGYERIDERLRALGVDIERVSE
jgi:UDP-N-acetylglucosamine 1-carboxyvinyltransferase